MSLEPKTLCQSLISPTFLCLLSIVASPEALAQQIGPNVRRGLASGLAAGLSLDRTMGFDLTLTKAPLDQSGAPTAWTRTNFPNGPDYSIQAMFPLLWQYIEIIAHSTGNDVIPPLDANGIPKLIQRQSWLAVNVSVSRDQVQGLPGSLIRQRRTSGTIGADIFSYYFDASVGIDPTLSGNTLLEFPGEAIRLVDNEEIDALDYGLGVISHARGTHSAVFFMFEDNYFFSVSNASATALNQSTPSFAVNSASQQVPANGATVYQITWNAIQGWSQPRVYRSRADLGLETEDDIDAVAVDIGNSTTVFSTAGANGGPQLLVHDPGVGVFPFANTAGTNVTVKLGSNDDIDDIDAVCIIDPEAGEVGTHLGVATHRLALWGVAGSPMGMCTTRMRPLDAMDDVMHFQLTGWGGATPAPGFLQFYMSFNYNPALGWQAAQWWDAGATLRLSTDDVVERTIMIPGITPATPVAMMAVFRDLGLTVRSTSLISETRTQ